MITLASLPVSVAICTLDEEGAPDGSAPVFEGTTVLALLPGIIAGLRDELGYGDGEGTPLSLAVTITEIRT